MGSLDDAKGFCEDGGEVEGGMVPDSRFRLQSVRRRATYH